MEKIQVLEIQLDIADRERLYDYVACKQITRPESSKEWDLNQLKQYGQVENYFTAEDENAMVRVNMMDKAFADSKKLDKKGNIDMGDSPEKEESCVVEDTKCISGTLPRRVLPIYKPGEVVRGRVVLHVTELLRAKTLSISFEGLAEVSIRVHYKHTYYDDKKEERFVKNKIVLWQRNEDTIESALAESFSLLSTSGPASSIHIPPGIHRFPFEFRIPADAPQSCPPVIARCADFAHLIYRLKATIDKDRAGKHRTISTYKGLWVETIYDIGTLPEARQPISREEALDTGVVQFWKAGKLSVNVTVPESAFVRGQNIPVDVEIDNQTKGEIKKAKARLRMYGMAHHGDGRISFSHIVDVTGRKVCEGPIAPGMCPSYRLYLPWDFSGSCVDGNLLPVGELNDTALLDIKYEIVVEIKRKGLHRNMEIHVPIIVGNVNSLVEGSNETGKVNSLAARSNETESVNSQAARSNVTRNVIGDQPNVTKPLIDFQKG